MNRFYTYKHNQSEAGATVAKAVEATRHARNRNESKIHVYVPKGYVAGQYYKLEGRVENGAISGAAGKFRASLSGRLGAYINRQNATIREEPAASQYVRAAIVWGTTEQISIEKILQIWYSKKRKVSVEIMLAKMLKESLRMPYISRYEVGMHTEQASWSGFSEMEATSYGLFQVMGFHLTRTYPAYRPTNAQDVYASFTIEKQFDLFDDMMGACLAKAGVSETGTENEAQARAAIVCYAGSNVPSIIEPNMQAWRALKARNTAYMQQSGLSASDIALLDNPSRRGLNSKLFAGLGFAAFVLLFGLLLYYFLRKKRDLSQPFKPKKLLLVGDGESKADAPAQTEKTQTGADTGTRAENRAPPPYPTD